MEAFEIKGQHALSGTISAAGSKNAAAPIIAATLLSREPSVLHNVPRIADVLCLLEIVESMGATVEWTDADTLRIDPDGFSPERIDFDRICRIRMSLLLLGPLCARFDDFTFAHPGGCVIGARPVDTHWDALRKLGVSVEIREKGYHIDASRRQAASLTLKEFSVTATENAMMLAAGLPGTTTIRLAAAEPHVEDLGRFLEKMGARVTGLGTHTLTIVGAAALRGAEHAVIPDPIEAATFLTLGVATHSPITVRGARAAHLDAVLEKLREFGADFTVDERNDSITVVPTRELRSPGKVKAEIYPGLPTDTQALFAVLATAAEGETLVHDHLFEGRFNYVAELEKMGADIRVLNPHQATVSGPTPLQGTRIRSFDLRAGASLIIAALMARGTTVIEEAAQVDRGYEKIEERLQRIGADIRRVTL